MQQRLQDNHVLNRLVAAYEEQGEDLNTFFDDKELLQIIDYYEGEYDYAKALDVAEVGLEQFSFNADFYIRKARVLALMEEYDEVHRTVNEGLIITPNELSLKLIGIHAHIEQGEMSNAKSKIKNLLANVKGVDRVSLLICKALIHEKEKDFEAMFNALKKALIIDPNELKALEKIWIAVELCKNYEESVLLHKYVIDRNPYNHQAWYNLGHAYACLGEYPESIMCLEYSFLIDETFEIGYKDCAEMCFQVGRFRQALGIYLDALKAFGIDMELLVSIGRCYLELKAPNEAERYLLQATKIDPYDDEAHYYLGQSYFHTGLFVEAISCFSEAIKLEDRREEYYADLAKSYHLIGDYTLANYYFNKATETGPEDVQYWFHHIVFLLDIQAIEAAEDVLQEAEFHTYGPEINYIYAAIAFHKDDRRKGLKLLTKAIEEDATCIDSFHALYPMANEDEEIMSLIGYFVA